jgi:polyketide biosynthesis acyl carrier protein
MDSVQANVYEVVKGNLLKVIPELQPSQVSIDRSLRELGCNSIDRADVVILTMEQLAITVPTSAFSAVGDIRTLVEVFARWLR